MELSITVEQILVKGERRLKVLNFCSRKWEELPIEYLKSGAHISSSQNKMFVYDECNNLSFNIEVGQVLTEKSFERLKSLMELCANKLKRINEEIGKELLVWNKVVNYSF